MQTPNLILVAMFFTINGEVFFPPEEGWRVWGYPVFSEGFGIFCPTASIKRTNASKNWREV